MPLKRHPALQDLSRDHHLFLLEARHIRQYLEDDERAKPLEDTIDSLLAFWKDVGDWHLKEEEEIVYPAYLANAPLKKREVDALYTDHNWLRDKFQDLSAMPRFENTKPILRSLGDYIVNHVRHEEQVIYNAIQETLDDAQLTTIAEKSRAFREEHREPDAIGQVQEFISLPEIED